MSIDLIYLYLKEKIMVTKRNFVSVMENRFCIFYFTKNIVQCKERLNNILK